MKKIKIQDPEAKLITILKLKDPVEAELIKNTLADHGIESLVDGEHQGGFTGTLNIGIIVKDTDAKFAVEVIKTHYPGHADIDTPE